MRTLDLAAAAAFLGLHPHTLQARAKAGEIPGAKVGKAWRFIDLDLAEYLRAQRGGLPCGTRLSGYLWRLLWRGIATGMILRST